MDAGGYKHKWRYEDKDRPRKNGRKNGRLLAVCYDCGLPYGSFPDMVIPDELWEEINPTCWQGAGILCPTCIANRLDYIGKWYAGDLFLLRVKDDAVFDVIERDVIPLEPSHTAGSSNLADAPTRESISP